MDTLILGALLGSVVIGFSTAVADLRRKKKSADLDRENCELKQQIQLKIADNTDLKRQLETVRNTNKLLSLEFDSANKEIRKLREFNAILRNDYNELRKGLKK